MVVVVVVVVVVVAAAAAERVVGGWVGHCLIINPNKNVHSRVSLQGISGCELGRL